MGTGQKAYEAWSAQRPGWAVTASGLQYRRVKAAKASAPKPAPDATVTIHYVGRFIDGRGFDSSRERGEPATFPPAAPDSGLAGRRADDAGRRDLGVRHPRRHRLRRALPRPHPANSTLLFEIELIAIPGEPTG